MGCRRLCFVVARSALDSYLILPVSEIVIVYKNIKNTLQPEKAEAFETYCRSYSGGSYIFNYIPRVTN